MWNRTQGVEESVDSYVTAMKKLARAVNVEGDQLRFAIQRGLWPQLIGHVIQSQPTSVDDVVKAARIAEAAASVTAAAKVDNSFERVITELTANREAAERNTAKMKRLATQLTAGATVNIIGGDSTATAPRSGPPARRGGFTGGQRGSR